MDILSELHDAIAEKIGRSRFDLWFGDKTRLQLIDETLRIEAPNGFFRDWMRTRMHGPLLEVCRSVLGRDVSLAIEMVGEAAPQGEDLADSIVVEQDSIAEEQDSAPKESKRAKTKSPRAKTASTASSRKKSPSPKAAPRASAKKKRVAKGEDAAQRRRSTCKSTRKKAAKDVVEKRPAAPTVIETPHVEMIAAPTATSTAPSVAEKTPSTSPTKPRAARVKAAPAPVETTNASSAHPKSDPRSTKTASQSASASEGEESPFRIVTGKDGKPRAVFSPDGKRTSRRIAKMRSLDSFVDGRSNQLARMGVELAIHQPGHVTPLYLYGPTSVGKSHLLEGVLTSVHRHRRGATAVLATAEQFTTEFLDALRGGGLPSFRAKYRKVDVLLLDDIPFFVGKRSTLNEFRYTLDTLVREGKQIVLTGDRPLAELRGLGADLLTRLESGMPCRIDPPEIETRLGIVRRLAVDMKIEVGEDIQRFIASRFTNHARELSGALCRLKAAKMATGQKVTIDMAKAVLDDLVRSCRRVVRLPDIERAVCETFGLTPETLKSKRRAANVSHPRMLAMWLARKHTRSALSEIGRYFGDRSHSTVASAKKRVDGWLDDRSELSLDDRTWTADEAIQSVERSLQAG